MWVGFTWRGFAEMAGCLQALEVCIDRPGQPQAVGARGRHYDLTLLSQGSSVRLDSFVYTVDGLREARSRLKSDGMLSLSFSVLSDALGHKCNRLLTEGLRCACWPATMAREFSWSRMTRRGCFLQNCWKTRALPTRQFFMLIHRFMPTSRRMTGRFSTCRNASTGVVSSHGIYSIGSFRLLSL